MTTYKLTTWGGIIKDGGAAIPPDSANMDYRDYLQFITEGGIPLPVDIPTQAQLDKEIEVNAATGIAKAWLASQQAAIDFVRLPPGVQAAQVDSMTLAQLRTIVKYLAVVVSAIIKKEYLP